MKINTEENMYSLGSLNLEQLKALPKQGRDYPLVMQDWAIINNAWSSITIVDSGEEHDSGWASMLVIGGDGPIPKMILSDQTDDIIWNGNLHGVHSDMSPKNGAIRFWSYNSIFIVGEPSSSLEIKIITK
jgi:hypothetical protein